MRTVWIDHRKACKSMLHTWLLECFSLHWWHLSRSDWRPTFNTRVQTTQRWWLFLLLLCILLSSTLKVDVNIDYGVEWPSVTSGAWMTSSCMPRMSETSTRWSFSIRQEDCPLRWATPRIPQAAEDRWWWGTGQRSWTTKYPYEMYHRQTEEMTGIPEILPVSRKGWLKGQIMAAPQQDRIRRT